MTNYPPVMQVFDEKTSVIDVPENIALVKEWLTDLRFRDVKNCRQYKLLSQICKLHKIGAITSNLAEFTTRDLKLAVITIRDLGTYTHVGKKRTYVKEYKPSTKTDYIRCLQQFLNWFEKHDTRFDDVKTQRQAKDLYSEVKKIKKDKQISERKREDVLTVSDFALMMRYEHQPVYRAIYSLLFYNGLRIGGILNIKVGDIIMHDNVWDIRITDKTGTDTVFVLEPRHYITAYLREQHPDPTNTDMALFITPRKRQEVTYQMVRTRLQNVRRRIQKIKPEWSKKVNPHWFRHSWATRNRGKMNDTLFKKQGKWAENSVAPSTYDHRDTDDYRKEFQEYKGVLSEDEIERDMWVCHTCHTENNPEIDLCQCGTPANFSVFAQNKSEYEDETEKTLEYLQKVLKDPLLRAKLQSLL